MNTYDGHNFFCHTIQLAVIDCLYAAEDFFYTEDEAMDWCLKHTDLSNGVFSYCHKLSSEEKQYLEDYSL